MPDTFDMAMAHTFGEEGDWSNHRKDHGGPTKLGITLVTLKRLMGERADLDGDGHVDRDDLRFLTYEMARAIYHEHYWCRPTIWAIPDRALACKVFDFGVNAGPRVAIAHLQLAVNLARPPLKVQPLKADGVIGARTLSALDQCDPGLVLEALKAGQRRFYLAIVQEDPGQGVFLAGWLKRAAWGGEAES